MIKTNQQVLSVEEVQQKIKNEAEKRKYEEIVYLQSHAPLAALTKKLKKAMINCTESPESNTDIITKSTEPFIVKEIYALHDFNVYYNKEFVQNAFIGILKRFPNSHELEYYVNLLRHGQYTKTEILVTLRFSKEGKSKKVNILGMKKRYIQAKVYKVPFLGYLSKLLYTLLTLPRLTTRLNQLENHFSTLHAIGEQNDLLLQEAINQCVKKDEFRDSFQDIDSFDEKEV